tara:strand:- start:58 stop:300 length:243 start_codon:yes stop_codon:yes gene_type:complete
MQDKKRYAVTLDVYVYAKDDYMARMEAHKIADHIDDKYPNARTNVTEIGSQPFGSLNYRKLDDKSRPSKMDADNDKPLPF